MKEVLAANKAKIDASDVLSRLNIESGKYIILSTHREENIDNATTFESIMTAVNTLAKKYELPIIYSVHPRSAKSLKEREFQFHKLVRESLPFKFTDYSKLMQNAYCVVSDSGTLPEEASVGNFPAVSIRTSTERPEALDKGVVIIGGVATETVLPAVDIAVNMFQDGNFPGVVPDYDALNISGKVIKIIQSYTPIVNRNVWRKAP
jgi:UDP-N-acetylglucosamine 2-epimerase (non-hydrolysing)